jgi:hypothetical protein
MRRVIAVALWLLIVSGAWGCDSSEPEDSVGIADLSVQVIDAVIYADLEPPVQPDPIVCRLALRMVNTNSDYPLSGVSVPSATLFLSSNSRELGTIPLGTDWDGLLEPGAVDTAIVAKSGPPAGTFDLPCGESVYLRLRIVQTAVQSKVVSTPSYVFACPMAAAREES